MGEPARPKGAILTVGLQAAPVTYSLHQIMPEFAGFLCTAASAATLDKALGDYPLPPSSVRRWELGDDPAQIGRLVHQFHDCFLWLRKDCGLQPQDILVDPTSGRKWMSAGATMIASFLGLNMFYVEVQMRDGRPAPETMRYVALGNAYNQTGFLEAEKGRELFNRHDFASAAETFSRLAPLLPDQADLVRGLADLSQALHRWDLFEHYEATVGPAIDQALSALRRAAYSAPDPARLQAFVREVGRLADGIEHVRTATKPALAATFDLLLNAERRLARGRYDDAVARTYRALESLSQYYLKADFGVDTGQPDYHTLNEAQREDALKALHRSQLPPKIALEDGWLILAALRHRAAAHIVPNGELRPDLRGLLRCRNDSILAHGWTRVPQRTARTFIEKVREALIAAEADSAREGMDSLKVPDLPPLWGAS